MSINLSEKYSSKLNLFTILIFLCFLIIYSLFFAYAYFRHDDWFIIGNALRRITQDINFLWRPILYFENTPHPWFFRPGFKISTLILYRVFGQFYQAWLYLLIALLCATLYVASKTLKSLNTPKAAIYFFIFLFLSCFHYHFPNLTWVGEGWMNLPQVFFLFLSTYFFIREKLILSAGAFLLALSFKESSLIHLIFLTLLAIQFKSIKKLNFIPLYAIGIVYILFRTLIFSKNLSYIPNYNWNYLREPIKMFGAGLFAPFILFIIFEYIQKHRIYFKAHILSLFFLITWILPHLGYAFFSPGWFLVPGIYLCFFLSLQITELNKLSIFFCILCFTFSSLGLFYKLNEVSWFEWSESQKKIVEIAQNTKEELKQVFIQDCSYNHNTSFRRVVGFEASLHELFALYHPQLQKVHIVSCDFPFKKTPGHLGLHFHFPKLSILP